MKCAACGKEGVGKRRVCLRCFDRGTTVVVESARKPIRIVSFSDGPTVLGDRGALVSVHFASHYLRRGPLGLPCWYTELTWLPVKP